MKITAPICTSICTPICLLALVALFPACVSEEGNASAAAKPGSSKPASKPTKPAEKKPAATDPAATDKAATDKAPEASHVDGAGAATLLADDPSITVLDIRTPDEYSAGHVKGAKNINFFAEDFAAKIGEFPKDKRYLVHCKSGGRSGKSLAKFAELGFTKIVHLDGGFDGWKAAGHPVEK